MVINGDYFDCKLSVGDTAVYYAALFFKELVDIAIEKKLIFRVLQGTRSHDLNQLQLFKPYECMSGLNLRIIESVCEENINGFNILFVPEEYPEDSDEYYKEFKSKKYDIMFVHGTFDFVAQPGQIELSKKNTHSAPVFIWDEWKEALSNGFVSAGHIHGRNRYKNKIYYSGSFSRWNFGERSDKGFTYFELDDEKELRYSVEFIDNKTAPIFDVVSVVDIVNDLENSDVKSIEQCISEQIRHPGDYLRVDLFGLPEDKIQILKEFYSNNPNIKIEVRDNKKSVIKESAEILAKYEKYHYITKREMPLPNTIQRFCKENLNADLTLDTINKILSPENEES